MLNEINLVIVFFFILLSSFLLGGISLLQLLLIAELLWVTLYALTLLIGLLLNDWNLLSLTFIFLIFSAIELGIGLELLSLQNILNRSLLIFSKDNTSRFLNRLSKRLYLTRIKWKI